MRRIVKEFIDARREWFIHPRWEEDGESISIVVSEPSKEEVEVKNRVCKTNFKQLKFGNG